MLCSTPSMLSSMGLGMSTSCEIASTLTTMVRTSVLMWLMLSEMAYMLLAMAAMLESTLTAR